MPEKTFRSNEKHTIGVELELQLIDQNTKELSSSTSKILKELGASQNVKHEFFECVIEINSNPCQTIEDLRNDLK